MRFLPCDTPSNRELWGHKLLTQILAAWPRQEPSLGEMGMRVQDGAPEGRGRDAGWVMQGQGRAFVPEGSRGCGFGRRSQSGATCGQGTEVEPWEGNV